MIDNNLPDKQENSEKQYRTERIRFLQAQINCHFLYTTLESMRGMLTMDRTQAFKTAVTQLASFYRYCSSQDIMATLTEEVQSAKDYFQLISLIMLNEITLEFDISEEIRVHMIPRMLIQPLVENALHHGYMRSRITEGTILIHAEKVKDLLCISVEDEGVGIPAEKIIELNTSSTEARDHIGIANIRERIHLLYPNTGSIEICSDGIRGATVYIQF